jgi:hypothetical protein
MPHRGYLFVENDISQVYIAPAHSSANVSRMHRRRVYNAHTIHQTPILKFLNSINLPVGRQVPVQTK